ncbi:MAG: serine/threonine protein kinase [Gammaproteobacteria bacterium]|nr:serine/threonine protein kinase [Gammaproteobacteria bacterium]
MSQERGEKARLLFDEAQFIRPELRMAFLENACGDDARLFDEAHSLVREHIEFSGSPNISATAGSAASSNTVIGVETAAYAKQHSAAVAQRQAATKPFTKNQRIGPYDVLSELGTGGMGVVYLALDTRLGRRVALKVLHSHLGNDRTAQQRLLVEAKSASRLDHPNICTVYELGESNGGRVYIAMAHCEGVSLDALLQSGPLKPRQAISLAMQIASGLEAAHAAGIFHRDIKPTNIIVDAAGRCKIVDFGVAKIAGIDITGAGHCIGTLSYMPPEQLLAETVDARADVWALGAVLYEMLTGKCAYGGELLPEIMHGVLNDPPPHVRVLLPELPEALDQLIVRALARKPDARHPSMSNLLVELSALRPRLEEKTGDRSWYPQPASLVQVLPRRIGVQETQQPAAVPGTAEACLQASQQELEHRDFKRARKLTEHGLSLSRGDASLTCLLGDIYREEGAMPLAQKAYRQVLDSCESGGNRCHALIGMAQCEDWNGGANATLGWLEQAQTIADAETLTPELARLHSLRGALYLMRGDINASTQQQKTALGYARQSGLPKSQARVLSGLGDAHYVAGRMLSAHQALAESRQLCEQHALGKGELANCFMTDAARIYQNQPKATLADALATGKTAAFAGHTCAEMGSRLIAAWVLIDRDEHDLAREQITLALSLPIDPKGGKHPHAQSRRRSQLRECLARILLAEGQLHEALTLADDALVACRKTGMQFVGPWVLGTVALIQTHINLSQTPFNRSSKGDQRRRAALAEGQVLLARGCDGHNYFQFYRAAIDVALLNSEWQMAIHYAQCLDDYTNNESTPWSDYFIRRGRALAWFGAGERSATLTAEIKTLYELGGNSGLNTALSGLKCALGGKPRRGH